MAPAEIGGRSESPQKRSGREAIVRGGRDTSPVLNGVVLPSRSRLIQPVSLVRDRPGKEVVRNFREGEVRREGLIGQLDQFLSTAKYQDGRLLRDPEMDMLVGLNRRPSGYQTLHGRTAALQEKDCLDIARIDLKNGITIRMDGDDIKEVERGTDLFPLGDFFAKVKPIVERHRVALLYVVDVKNKRLAHYFTNQGDWEQIPKSDTDQGSPLSFFRWF